MRASSRLGAALLVTVVVAGLSLVAPAGATATPAGGCFSSVGGLDLETATIPQIESALRKGTITSRALVQTYLDRIAAYNKPLDAIRTLNPDALKIADRMDAELRAGHANGPLFGIPVLLKDNVDTSTMPTTAGSQALAGSVPLDDATVTTKLESAGAIILGKTNLSEFAGWTDLNAPPGYSSLGGQVHNPYQFSESPSGSSAGSGVAAAMAFAAGTVGTETSGSILSPSNANSDVGIKPTTGLLSRFGILPLSPSFDTPGPIARDVTDAAVMLSAMAGEDPKDARTAESKGNTPPGLDYTRFLKRGSLKGTRIGYSDHDRTDLGTAEQKVFEQALADLKKLGATLVKTDNLYYSSAVGLSEIAAIPNEFKASLNQYLATETSDSLRVRTLSDIVAYNSAHPKKMKYGQSLLQASDDTPGNQDAGTPNKEVAIESSKAAIDGTLAADNLDAIIAPGPVYANVSAAAGYPTVIVPSGYTGEGTTPLGLSFLGTGYSEPKLISYAYDYEQAAHRRVPPTDANPQLVSTGCS